MEYAPRVMQTPMGMGLKSKFQKIHFSSAVCAQPCLLLFQLWINVQHQKNQRTLRGPKSVKAVSTFPGMRAKQAEEVPGTDIPFKPLLKTAPHPMFRIFSQHILPIPSSSLNPLTTSLFPSQAACLKVCTTYSPR